MSEQNVINEALKYVIDLTSSIWHYPYHNINHTLDVYSRVVHLTDREMMKSEDRTDLLLAALFHDTWFIKAYFQNEIIWAKIAREYLEKIGWKEERIKKIENIILATIMFSKPSNKLEKIIQDADFDNFGRRDFMVKGLLVKKEMNSIWWRDISIKEWNKFSYNLMRQHKFNTATAKRERDSVKKENTLKLKKKIK